MVKVFNNLEEIQKYYDENTNTYIFKEDDDLIDSVIFNFNLKVSANIVAWDIKAWNIDANNIDARDINALDINANDIYARDINTRDIRANDIYAWDIMANDINAKDISYFAVCYAYQNIICKSIKGRAPTTNHFVLYGKLEVLENEKL